VGVCVSPDLYVLYGTRPCVITALCVYVYVLLCARVRIFYNIKSPMSRSSKFLLVLANTVVLDFGPLRNSWPNFY
jgi:hypothetical protein